jgi:glycosyltransferase involved in cell wall biosynthesis
MKFMIVRVLKLAKRVICVSYATKEAIEEIYAEKCFKIEVIHEGAAENFFPITDEKYLSQIKEKYKLPNKFILYVGSIRRHKNINMLLESFLKIKAKLKDVSLVMVGRVSHALDLKMEDIRYLGEIPDDKELTAIYNLASCLCNVSLYEGFSLTILEAQKCSTAVVCSNIPTHVETGGDGIFAVNPTNVDQIEQALYNVLTDNNLRNALIKKGLENTQRFNWADTAAKTIAIYKELKD